MKYRIRSIKSKELSVLDDMLYLALHQPEGMPVAAKDAIYKPEVYAYIKDFGSQKDDYCLVADFDGCIVGAVWVRILDAPVKGYGNIDKNTPEFAISVVPEHRGKGIGGKLIQEMLFVLANKGYKTASLSVAKTNHAKRLYERTGFYTVKENEHDFLMVIELDN